MLRVAVYLPQALIGGLPIQRRGMVIPAPLNLSKFSITKSEKYDILAAYFPLLS
jgi:hypothetical protein